MATNQGASSASSAGSAGVVDRDVVRQEGITTPAGGQTIQIVGGYTLLKLPAGDAQLTNKHGETVRIGWSDVDAVRAALLQFTTGGLTGTPTTPGNQGMDSS